MTLMGEPFARASSAAEPAVEPTSMLPLRSASLALFEPADLTHSTFLPSADRAVSSQPFLRIISESGL